MCGGDTWSYISSSCNVYCAETGSMAFIKGSNKRILLVGNSNEEGLDINRKEGLSTSNIEWRFYSR